MQIHLQRCICTVDQAKGKIWGEEVCKNLACRGENRNLGSDFRRRETLGVANICASLQGHRALLSKEQSTLT